MSTNLVVSLDAINRSDSSSQTEGQELTPPRPEQHDDMAQSPFVPQRARLMPGGPPVYLGEPLRIEVPRFLVDPDCRAVPGQSPPGDMPLDPTFQPDIDLKRLSGISIIRASNSVRSTPTIVCRGGTVKPQRKPQRKRMSASDFGAQSTQRGSCHRHCCVPTAAKTRTLRLKARAVPCRSSSRA